MSQSEYLKCPCRQCGSPIEFPPHGVGLAIECPHCGQKTVLGRAPATGTHSRVAAPVHVPTDTTDAAEAESHEPARSRVPLVVGLVILLLAAAGGGWWWFNRNSAGDTPAPQAPSFAGKMAAIDASEPKPAPATPAAPASPPAPKSIDDLKAGAVTLEKARSGSLVYAVGTVRNESDHQRFGVKVELEFTDAQGRPAGKATDYTQVIEPRKEWRFRALVLDAKAASGRVAVIKEDN